MTEPLFLLHTPGNLALRLGEAFARAFHTKPYFSFLLPDQARREGALAWFWGEFAARLAIRYGSVQVNQEGIAGAFMLAPGRTPSCRAIMAAGLFSFPSRLGWLGSWRMSSLGLHLYQLRKRHAPMPHWYVVAMGVSPDRQGQGMGHALLTQGIRRAEADGVACYVQAFSEPQARFLEKRGFEIRHQEDLPMGLAVWSMVRMPSQVEVRDNAGRQRARRVKKAH